VWCDTDTNTNTDGNCNSNSNCHSYGHSYGDCGTHAYPNPDAYPNRYCYGNRHAPAVANANRHNDGDTNTPTIVNADRHTNGDAQPHCNSHGYTHAYAEANHARCPWLPAERAAKSGSFLERGDFESRRPLPQRRFDRHAHECRFLYRSDWRPWPGQLHVPSMQHRHPDLF
jgi:hypothetical protein